jgi:hypothetical protein
MHLKIRKTSQGLSLNNHSRSQISKDQSRDTGLAMVLICLILGHFSNRHYFVLVGIFLLVLCMVWPLAFRHLGKLWFGLAHILGAINSRIILTVVFFLLVTPIGYLRRTFGWDPMQIKKWKKDDSSAFRERNKLFQPDDVKHPY